MANHRLRRCLWAMPVLLLFMAPLSAATYQYDFPFQGKKHVLELDFSRSLVQHYENKTHYWPTSLSAYPNQAKEDPGFTYLAAVAGQIESQAAEYGYSDWELVQFTTAFVQNLTYYAEQQEYVRYPIETLADKGGDCEDTAILLAALINEMGYDAKLVHFPGHMMAAIACSNCEGATLSYEGQQYVLVESTAGVGIGNIDKRFAGSKATVLEMDQYGAGNEVFAVNNPRKAQTPNAPQQQLPEHPGFIEISHIEVLMGLQELLKREGFTVIPEFSELPEWEDWGTFSTQPESLDPDQFQEESWTDEYGTHTRRVETTTSRNGTVTTTTVTTYTTTWR